MRSPVKFLVTLCVAAGSGIAMMVITFFASGMLGIINPHGGERTFNFPLEWLPFVFMGAFFVGVWMGTWVMNRILQGRSK